MSNLKILYVDTDKQWRGGQEQLLSLMLGMKSRQHQTFLAAPSEAPLSRKAQEANIPMLPFQQRNDLSPSAFFRLFDIIRTRKFDIVHINSPRAILSGSIMSKLCAVPLRICSRRVNFPLKSWLFASCRRSTQRRSGKINRLALLLTATYPWLGRPLPPGSYSGALSAVQ